MRTLIPLIGMFAAAASAADVRLVGIAGVELKVSDLARSQHFYTGVLGLEGAGLRYDINDRQSILLVPDRKDTADHRIARFRLAAADVRSACAALRPAVEMGDDGSCTLSDPDGNRIVISRPAGTGLKMPAALPISTRLRHVGIQVRDLDRAARFYCKKLHLVPEELHHGKTRWFNMHLPGGDYIQMQLTPEDATARRWPFEHVALDVTDAHATYETLIRRGIAHHRGFEPVVGYAGHLKINFSDPDDTLIELMELGTANAGERREK